MRRLLPTIAFVIFIINITFCQNDLNVSNITDSLKTNANAVCRFHTTIYNRVSVEKYSVNVHYAVTILSQKGKHASDLTIHYDRNSQVSGIKGFFYNKDGILLSKLKKKDVNDYAGNNRSTLFSDHRVKQFTPVISTFPYTVEYSYSTEHKGIVGFDTWMPQDGYNMSVEKAELIFNTPKDWGIRYLELNNDFELCDTIIDKIRQYKWTARNLKAIEYEPSSPNYLDFMPSILLSPNEIVYEKTKGNFSSWNSYGKWVYSLIKGCDILSEETVRYIKALTDTIEDQKDKVELIYKYMQSKTRYINIALGIGGFQPISAMEVDEKGYGDCKALSNYTKALLKCAGIESYYTEIGSGKYKEIKFHDFASANQTNHIILCVPIENDTIWLECTNQNIPFGYIGLSNSNRYALLIKQEGGELVRTPKPDAAGNARISNINISINDVGGADFELNTGFKNYMFEEIFGLLNLSKKEQKDALLKGFSAEGVSIIDFSVEELPGSTAQGSLKVRGNLSQYATKIGARLIFTPEYFFSNNVMSCIPNNRELDLYQPLGFLHIDTLRVSIPDNYQVEYLPKGKQLTSIYGEYSLAVENSGQMITIVRELKINEGKYIRPLFNKINKFLCNISDCDNEKIIVIRK